MLIPYFVRYRASRCFRRLHGKVEQEKQYFPLISAQLRIRHFGCSHPGDRQPGQWFFSRRYAIQIPQFMPQGAIRVVFIVLPYRNLGGCGR